MAGKTEDVQGGSLLLGFDLEFHQDSGEAVGSRSCSFPSLQDQHSCPAGNGHCSKGYADVLKGGFNYLNSYCLLPKLGYFNLVCTSGV